MEFRVTVRDIKYVILVLCPRGVKLMKVGNPTLTPERHKLTSSIFALYIISATKFMSCSSKVHVYECLEQAGCRVSYFRVTH